MTSDAEHVSGSLEAAVGRLVKGRRIAVAFSGGLDSGLVAAIASRYAISVKLYTAGFEGAYDVRAAREVSDRLGLEWEHILLEEEALTDSLKEAVRITGTADPLTLAFEIPLFHVMSACSEEHVATGQGADELFAGFAKYLGLSAAELTSAREEDMRRLSTSTSVHERGLAGYFRKELINPFMERDLIETVDGLGIGAVMPAGPGGRKALLKEVAVVQGVPFLADAEKKAAQYGSGAMAALKRICKAEGIGYRELIARICAERETPR